MPDPKSPVSTQAWEWRKAIGGAIPQPRSAFHAYDVNDNAACDVGYGLLASVQEPHEGSELCLACMEFVKANPAGREERVYD
jgi:hypothetical protein